MNEDPVYSTPHAGQHPEACYACERIRPHLRALVQATTKLVSAFEAAMAPPPPKTQSGMTSREYRAERRRYARNQRWMRDAT